MAWNLFWLQSLITLFLSTIFAGLYGRAGIIAALMGGLSAIIPAASSAQLFFRGSVWDTPRQWINRLVRGQMVKFALSIILSGAIFYVIDPLPGVMFCAWAAALLINRIYPFWATK